jgi:hypothetical protein
MNKDKQCTMLVSVCAYIEMQGQQNIKFRFIVVLFLCYMLDAGPVTKCTGYDIQKT